MRPLFEIVWGEDERLIKLRGGTMCPFRNRRVASTVEGVFRQLGMEGALGPEGTEHEEARPRLD